MFDPESAESRGRSCVACDGSNGIQAGCESGEGAAVQVAGCSGANDVLSKRPVCRLRTGHASWLAIARPENHDMLRSWTRGIRRLEKSTWLVMLDISSQKSIEMKFRRTQVNKVQERDSSLMRQLTLS